MPNNQQLVLYQAPSAPKKAKKSKKNKNKKKKAQVNSQLTVAPVAVGTKVKSQKQPKVKYATDGSCVISHTEFVTDISGISGGYSSYLEVNPEKSGVFPWLCSIASRFEMYRFEKLKFHYKPSCATSVGGWMALGFDFDQYDADPTKQQLLNWKYASKCAPWQSISLDVSPDSRMSTYRYTNITTQGDKRLDNIGKIHVLNDTSSSGFIGELMVEYRVKFRQPAMSLPAMEYLEVTSGAWTTTTANANKWFASGVKIAGNIAYKVIDDATLQFLQGGKYLVSSQIIGSTVSGDNTLNGSTPANTDGEGTLVVKEAANTTTRALTNYVLDITRAPFNVTWATSGTAATVLSEAVRIASIL